jgi:hypothetical protein
MSGFRRGRRRVWSWLNAVLEVLAWLTGTGFTQPRRARGADEPPLSIRRPTESEDSAE